jgi:hypothetical protein
MNFFRWLFRIGLIWLLGPIYIILGSLKILFTYAFGNGFSGFIIAPLLIFIAPLAAFFTLLGKYFLFDFKFSDWFEECDWSNAQETASHALNTTRITKAQQPTGSDNAISRATRKAQNEGANIKSRCDFCRKSTRTHYPSEYTEKGRYCPVCGELK